MLANYYNQIFKWILRNRQFFQGAFGTILLYQIYNFSVKQRERFNLLFYLQSLPYLKDKVNLELEKAKETLTQDMNVNKLVITKKLPDNGLTEEEINNKIELMSKKDYSDGKISGIVYYGCDDKYKDFLVKIFSNFAWTNPLHPDLFPRIRNMEIDIIKMTKEMFNGDENVCGNVTYGGTESLLLACKTYRDWGFYHKNISNPNIVVLESVHAAIQKAGNYFGIKIKVVPIDPETGTATIKMIRSYIDMNTVCLIGSTPSYAHGIMDPIEDMAKIAEYKGIGLHVDACMGGFLIPFLKKEKKIVENFDFSLKGVTSISADTHKYGYSLKGSSVILYRNFYLKKHQHFSNLNWNGGIYATPTIMGSKSGALIAATWAAMLYHGYDKYIKNAIAIKEMNDYVYQATKDISGIKIIGKPNINIIAYRSDGIDIYRIASILKNKGWNLSILQNPPSFHLCITKLHLDNDLGKQFVTDLKESIKKYLKSSNVKLEGTVAIYGMATSVNSHSIINSLVDNYIGLLSNDIII
jgi:sphinganine-1-phosphate aldolase